jgi:hypothetical protein
MLLTRKTASREIQPISSFASRGNKAEGFVGSLGLRPRVQRNVLALGEAMKFFKRVETCDIIDMPLLEPLILSARRRLTKGCQIHVS